MSSSGDFVKDNHIHLVGIKGVAMTALAVWAQEQGMKVTGSDVADSFPTDAVLARYHIVPDVGFKPSFTQKPDVVVYTGAHGGSSNPQVTAAISLGIPTYPHGKALGMIMAGSRGISVCGTHGKTTTSAMIAFVLMRAGLDPSYLVGCADIIGLDAPGHWGHGNYFVAEADEYMTDPGVNSTPRFLWQHPYALVMTNIEYDHPDAFADLRAVEDAFVAFSNNVIQTGFIIACTDNQTVKTILPRIQKRVVTYGFENADFEARNLIIKDGLQHFTIVHNAKELGVCTLAIPGRHTVLNATATIACLVTCGIPFAQIVVALATFTGTKRRFEYVGQKNGTLFYDDYAHHPTEIAATLAAARQQYPDKRIIAVFQPHTYSRTLSLLSEFAQAFSDASQVVIADIYPSAREKPVTGVSGKILVEAISRVHDHVVYQPKRPDVVQYIKAVMQPQNVIITMGAGNIYQWISDIV